MPMASTRASLRRKCRNKLSKSNSEDTAISRPFAQTPESSAAPTQRADLSDFALQSPSLPLTTVVAESSHSRHDAAATSGTLEMPVPDLRSDEEICINFNKGQCKFGPRCKKRHLLVTKQALWEVEASLSCKFSSKDECLFKGCRRTHGELESRHNLQASSQSSPLENSHSEDFNPHLSADGSKSKENIVTKDDFPFEQLHSAVVQIPPGRKVKKSRKSKRSLIHFKAVFTSLTTASDANFLANNTPDEPDFYASYSDPGTPEDAVVRIGPVTPEQSRISTSKDKSQHGPVPTVADCTFCVLGLCKGLCQQPSHTEQVVTKSPQIVTETLDESPMIKITSSDKFTDRHPTELNISISSRMTVTIGPGMQVIKIATADESTSILINNVPSFISEDDIRSLCAQFGDVKLVRVLKKGHQESSVKVSFETIEEAGKAASKLNGKKHFFSVLSVRVCLPGWGRDPSVGLLSNNLVLIEIPPPGRTVYVGFSTALDAQRKISNLRGTKIRGNTIGATLYEGIPRIAEWMVRFECLPEDFKVNEIRSLTGLDTLILMGQASYPTVSVATSLLQPYLDSCGRIIKSDMSDYPKGGRMQWKVYFSTPEAASKACSTINGLRFRCLGEERIYAKHLHAVSYVVPNQVFAAIEPGLSGLQDLAHRHHLQLSVLPTNNRGNARLKLSGSARLDVLKKVKSSVERLLAGQTVEMDSGPVWDEFFGQKAGTVFCDDLAHQTFTTIRADANKGHIIVWGSPGARHDASRRIIEKVIQLQSSRTFSLPLMPGMVSKLLGAELIVIHDILGGEHNTKIDLAARCLRFRGTSAQHRSVCALLRDSTPSRLNSDSSPLVLTDEKCPICLSPVLEPMDIGCAHKTCKSCLARYISSSINHRSFPLKCLGDDANCPELLPAALCRQLVHADVFMKVVEAAFQSYTAARPTEFRRCPSANCAQIYKLQNEGKNQSLQCPACLIRVCPHCHEEEHGGYLCASMVEEDQRLYDQWKEEHDVHPCPNCHADIEKSAGCNHMTCLQCKTHICWACLKTFADGPDVYQHMREVHGGIG